MLKGYRLRDYNFKLVFLVLVVTLFGTIVIHSADSSYTMKQVVGLVGCLCVMVVVSLIGDDAEGRGAYVAGTVVRVG